MHSYTRLQISRTGHVGSELLKSCYLAVPWPAGKFHREELVGGPGFTQMPRLLPHISDPHRPTLIRINEEEHGLQVCRQETGPGPIPSSLTQEGCWPYLHGRVKTTQALDTAFASSASQWSCFFFLLILVFKY